jgi:hypothetical protein
MTGKPGGIEELLGGPRRAVTALIAFIVVTGVAIGALAYVAFGKRNAPPPATGAPSSTSVQTSPPGTVTVQVPYSTSQEPKPCQGLLRVDGTGVSVTPLGLLVSTALQTSCGSVDVLSGPAVKVTVSDSARDVAAGIFDLTTDPIMVWPGQQVQQQFVFPAGMYWRTTELVAGDKLTVDVSNFTRPSPGSTPYRSGSNTLTAAQPTAPAHGSAEGTATDALKELSGHDYAGVKQNLENWWVPQISSKRVGLFADGITYNNVDILRDHLTLRQRYLGVRLIWSGNWTSFSGSNWWITVIGQPVSTAILANQWCDDQRIDADNCFAKMISSIYGPDGTTVLRK